MDLVGRPWMEHATLFIAIDFIKDTNVEHPVVDDQEEDRPFDERHIETFDAFLDEGGFVMKILRGKEEACRDEEKRHVEFEDKLTQPAWCLGMGYHHQDDGYALRNRNNGIPFHFSLLTFHFLQPGGEQAAEPSAELLPARAETVPFLFGEEHALQFVTVEHIIEFLGSLTIHDQSVLFVVET